VILEGADKCAFNRRNFNVWNSEAHLHRGPIIGIKPRLTGGLPPPYCKFEVQKLEETH
jgi:hypothetical protein